MRYLKGCSLISVKENLFHPSNVVRGGIIIKMNRWLEHLGHPSKIINLFISVLR